MGNRVRLKKDIIIPAGTVFNDVKGLVVEYGRDNYEHTLGLTKDSHGSLIYGLDRADPALEEWFEDCE